MSFINELVKRGIVNRYQIDDVLQKAGDYAGGLEEFLIKSGIEEDALLDAKSEYYHLPKFNVQDSAATYPVLRYIPEASARHYRMVPLGTHDGILDVGVVDPDDSDIQNALQFISAKEKIQFNLIVITYSDFLKVVEGYGGMEADTSSETSAEESELLEELEASSNKDDIAESKEVSQDREKSDKKIVEDAPVAKMVAVILRHATEGGASDIHIEHTGAKVKVRFRVDGTLHTSLILPGNVHSALVARIKILTKLKIDEKRRPQDGRFPAKIDGRKIDFRVSTFPTAYGEKVVIRILDPEGGVKGLDKTGMSEFHVKTIRAALKRPYGMILVTGPTGSGKTTTLYSMLREVDREGKNVISLEDPVEYLIDGVSQSQVKPEIGYTFASGLRSILRQDPDIIFVGEIRDKETAQLAIQAALTGHLVFSTLHTNSAVGVIPRLVDMGVDPYLIAPTLILAVGQRLIKRACKESLETLPADESVKVMLEKQFSTLPDAFRKDLNINRPLYDVKATPTCPSGTKGRVAVFEMLAMNREIEEAILKDPTELTIFDAARRAGMITMKEDAILKNMEGLIPFTEINEL